MRRHPIEAIVTRVADQHGVGPLELDPVASAVDPDLVCTFTSSEAVPAGAELQFVYSGCTVGITGDGAVTVGECE